MAVDSDAKHISRPKSIICIRALTGLLHDELPVKMVVLQVRERKEEYIPLHTHYHDQPESKLCHSRFHLALKFLA